MKLSKRNAARQRAMQRRIASGKTLSGLLVGLTAATVVGGCKEVAPARTMGIVPNQTRLQANDTNEKTEEFVTTGVIVEPTPRPPQPIPRLNAVREQEGKPVVMGKMPARDAKPPAPPAKVAPQQQ